MNQPEPEIQMTEEQLRALFPEGVPIPAHIVAETLRFFAPQPGGGFATAVWQATLGDAVKRAMSEKEKGTGN